MLLVNESYIPINELLVINESKDSDDFEIAVADNINKLSKDHNYTAEHPVSDNRYSDVIVTRKDGISAWLEVKMNHKAGMGSPRVYYSDYEGGWNTTYESPAAKFYVDILNKSNVAKKWVNTFKVWLCNELKTTKNKQLLSTVTNKKESGEYSPRDLKIVLPTTEGGLRAKGAIPYSIMKRYVNKNKARYVLTHVCDITKLVTDHYTKGKSEPTYYIQSGDDLYHVGDKNPFGWKVPDLKAPNGTCSIRVSLRNGTFYEIQCDTKIHEVNSSEYSLKPGSSKKIPF